MMATTGNKEYRFLYTRVKYLEKEIKQLDVGVSPPAFSFTLIVTLTFDPDVDLL